MMLALPYSPLCNGTRKEEAENKMFMDPASVREVLLSLKVKNTEGYDRIPQRILADGADFLVVSFEGLFDRICQDLVTVS